MSFAREIGKALIALRISHLFTIKRNGYKVHFFPSSMGLYLWEAKLRKRTIYQDDEAFFKSYLKESDVVIDIGANIGLLSLASSQVVGENGHIYSFEAHPQTSSYLKSNIELNKFTNITAFSLALGEKKGKVYFEDCKNDDLNKVTSTHSGIEVEMDTLDNMAISAESIALLKVDVEGYEKFVFEGASATLKRTQCIYFEYSQDHFSNFGYSASDLNRLILSHGFRLFKKENKTLLPIQENYVPTQKVENLIAVKDIGDFCNRIKTNYQLAV